MQREAEAKAEVQYEGISVCIIGKNCVANLKECLASLKPFVQPQLGDEVVYVDTGSTDDGKTNRLAKKWGCRIIKRPDLSDDGMIGLVEKYLPDRLEEAKKDPQFSGGFLRDFSEARTLANTAAKNDLIFWVDTDDILEGGAKLRALAHQFFTEDKQRNALFLRYDYAFDEDGTCTTELWRERILRKSQYKWLGICHETLIPRDMNPELAQRCPHPDVAIKHKNHRESVWSDVRNYVILMNAHDKAIEAGEWIDPRWIFYIGNAHRGMEDYDNAIKWYCRLLKTSGSRDDRFTAALNISIIHQLRGRHWLAIDWLWQCVKIFPTEPRVWFSLARCYHELGKHSECLQFTDWGKQLPNPGLLTAVDPTGYDFYPDMFAAMSCRELGDYRTMVQCAEACYQRRPNWPAAQELVTAARNEAGNQGVKQAIGVTCRHAASVESQKTIIQNLKPEVRKGFRELQIEAESKRAPKTITYLCTETAECWDGKSSVDGVGGSEKMVMLLAREWVKAGWKVEVFGNPKEENCYKKIDGVFWKPVQSFNAASEYDVIIGWRAHGYLDMPLKARKIFMDLHDVQNPGDYLDARTMRCDGYFFKSEFHAEPVRDRLPPEKVIISRNGVDLTHFEGKAERQKHKAIFCSSGDRGLKRALQVWQRVCGGYPDAELHVFYGFTPLFRKVAASQEYAFFGDDNAERHMLDYEEECYSLVDKTPSVKYHGRVSHEVLAKHLETSSVWLYPTHFPEISCMAAMEAQVAGCVPVLFPTGALDETVQHGIKCDTDDDIINGINRVFTDEAGLVDERKQITSEAVERFRIDTLAASWLEHFACPQAPSTSSTSTEPSAKEEVTNSTTG